MRAIFGSHNSVNTMDIFACVSMHNVCCLLESMPRLCHTLYVTPLLPRPITSSTRYFPSTSPGM